MTTRYRRIAGIIGTAVVALAAAIPAAAQTSVMRVRVEDAPASTRLVLTSTAPLPVVFETGPSFLLIHFETTASPRVKRDPFESRFVKSVGWSRGEAGFTMAVTTAGPFAFEHTLRREPFELVVEIRPAVAPPGSETVAAGAPPDKTEKIAVGEGAPPLKAEIAGAVTPPPATGVPPDKAQTAIGNPASAGALAAAAPPEKAAAAIVSGDPVVPVAKPPVAAGDPPPADKDADARAAAAGNAGDLTPQGRRVKTIIIDPGHGGIEAGAKGEFGTLEKEITLAIGLKLKTALERGLASRVFMTREKDEDVALDRRAALANNHKADLFISLHANGSRRKNAQGSETFYLSLNATDEETRRLAYLENESGRIESAIQAEDQDDIKLILWDLAQTAYLQQSARLAEIIQAELNELLGTRDRGVKQAPFKVLTGVACPAVLVEVAFISNPDEERKLLDEAFQNGVVQAVYRGLVKYLQLYP